MMVGKGWAVREQQEGKPSHLGDYYSWYYPDHEGSHGAGIPPPARPLPGERPQSSVPVSAAVFALPRGLLAAVSPLQVSPGHRLALAQLLFAPG